MRILIIRLSALGDALHALPMVNELHRQLPTAEIDWAAGPGVAKFLDGHHAVNRFIVVKRSLGGYRQFIAETRGRYDCAIDAQGLIKSATLGRLASRRVIGRAPGYARELPATFFYTDLVKPSGRHIIDQNLDLLAPLDLPSQERQVVFDLKLPAVPAWPLLSERPVLLNPGGGWWTKLWPLDRFRELARRIHGELGWKVGVVWGPGEEEMANRICENSPAEKAPPTTFRELGACLTKARCLVSGETGPLHLAAAVGCRTIALFGPTTAARNGPYGDGHVSIEPELYCRPCYGRTCADFRCMGRIEVKLVIDAVRICRSDK